MRNKALHVVVAVCVFMFLVASSIPSFAAKAAPSNQVKAVQTELKNQGYKVTVDGKMGKQTRSALMKYQKAQGLPATGKTDSVTLMQLGVR